MGFVRVDLFTTLDGVAQSPGAPDEDPDGAFAFGGWQAPLLDGVAGGWVQSGMVGMDALLLGRRTYDIFAAYWPAQDSEIAHLFNRLPKYVASRGTPPLPWAGSTLLDTDLPAAIRDLRQRHENIHVIGSVDFVHSLLAERLVDEMTLWVHPILLGHGKKVFTGDVTPATLELLEPATTSPNGVVQLRYRVVGTEPPVGDMTRDDR
ncbi:dihydrofolate reductase family protein [Microbacterium sp. P04]|uniref:dihydrofolate reductase family protein n=1 Tax=Microbacterium sp. P04 TaxID=3366947 RepID=UPI003745672A